jgi:hypothetical protein
VLVLLHIFGYLRLSEWIRRRQFKNCVQVLWTGESTEDEAIQRLELGSTLMARLKAVETLMVHSLDGTVEGTYSVLL